MTTNSNSLMLVRAPKLSWARQRIEGSLESCKKIPTPNAHLLNSSQLCLSKSLRSESSRAMGLALLKIWLSRRGQVLQQINNRLPTSRLVGKRRAWLLRIQVTLSLPQRSTIQWRKFLHLKSQRWMLWSRLGATGTSWEANVVPHVMIEVRVRFHSV